MIGMDNARASNIITDLNLEYAYYLKQHKTIHGAYTTMVHKNAYRILANNEYNEDETPIKKSALRNVNFFFFFNF